MEREILNRSTKTKDSIMKKDTKIFNEESKEKKKERKIPTKSGSGSVDTEKNFKKVDYSTDNNETKQGS